MNENEVDVAVVAQQVNARLNNLIREQQVALEAWDAARAKSSANIIYVCMMEYYKATARLAVWVAMLHESGYRMTKWQS